MSKSGGLLLTNNKQYNNIPETTKTYFVVMVTHQLGKLTKKYHMKDTYPEGMFDTYKNAKKKRDKIIKATLEAKERAKNDGVINYSDTRLLSIIHVEIRRVTEVVSREVTIHEPEDTGEQFIPSEHNVRIIH